MQIKSSMDETIESIHRPVVYGVLEVASKLLGVGRGTTKVNLTYNGDSTQPVEWNSQIGSSSRDEVRFDSASSIYVTAQEETEPTTGLTMPVFYPNNRLIFTDNISKVYLKPVYDNVLVTIDWEFRSNSRAEILRWKNNLRKRLGHSNNTLICDASYNYPIPKETIGILGAVYDAKETLATTGHSFEDYLTDCFNNNLTTLTTQLGTHKTYAMKEHQSEILVFMDVDLEAEVEKQEEGVTYTSKLTLTFRYDKVIDIVAEYPWLVGDTPVSSQYLPSAIREYEYIAGSDRTAYDVLARNSALRSQHTNYGSFITPINVPFWDDFSPPRNPRGYERIASVAVVKDNAAPNTILDLSDVSDEYILPEWVIDHMLKHHEGLIEIGNCLLYVNLTYDGLIVGNDRYTVNKYLQVMMNDKDKLGNPIEMSCYKRKHINIYLCTSIKNLSEHAKRALCTDDIADLYSWLGSIFPEYRAPDITDIGTVNPGDYGYPTQPLILGKPGYPVDPICVGDKDYPKMPIRYGELHYPLGHIGTLFPGDAQYPKDPILSGTPGYYSSPLLVGQPGYPTGAIGASHPLHPKNTGLIDPLTNPKCPRPVDGKITLRLLNEISLVTDITGESDVSSGHSPIPCTVNISTLTVQRR